VEAEFTSRNTNAVDWSYIVKQEHILHPEMLALKLKHRAKPFDIGGVIYSKRLKYKGSYWVDKETLVPSRRGFLIALLDRHVVKGTSDRSFEKEFKDSEYALSWCDENGFSDVLCNAESARVAYLSYTSHLFQLVVGDGGLEPTTGSNYQSGLRRALEIQFPLDVEYIITGVPSIQGKREGLEPPEERHVREYVDLTLLIAFTFSRFLISSGNFPFKLETSDYHTYVFPGNGKFITPLTERDHGFMAHDYKLGRVKTIEEMSKAHPDQKLFAFKDALAGRINRLQMQTLTIFIHFGCA